LNFIQDSSLSKKWLSAIATGAAAFFLPAFLEFVVVLFFSALIEVSEITAPSTFPM
jgi:hypothetical protein